MNGKKERLSIHTRKINNNNNNMVKGLNLSNNEEEFLLASLEQGIREDGREMSEFRDVDIRLGQHQPGYVDVQLGRTRVAVRVSGHISKPYEDRPFEGIFTIATEVGPIAGAFFEHGGRGGANSEDEVLVTRLVEKAVRRLGALDLEALCIVAGEKCWHIRADVHFLDFDGGFIDASCIGVMTALQHFKRPEVSVQGEQVVVHPVSEREPVGLPVLHVPLCVTFSFFNTKGPEENVKGDGDGDGSGSGDGRGGEFAVVDATMKEEALRKGQLTVTMNRNKEVCQVQKSGGMFVDAVVVMECVNKAYLIVEELSEKIKRVLKEDD